MAVAHSSNGASTWHYYCEFLEGLLQEQLVAATNLKVFVRPFSEGGTIDPCASTMSIAFQFDWMDRRWAAGIAHNSHGMGALTVEKCNASVVKEAVLLRRIMRGWVRRRPHGRSLALSMRKWGAHA